MSYHVEVPRSGFKELPDQILVREDGYLGAYKFYGEPIVDYWYVPEQRMTDTERESLCKRIDELCQEVEQLRKQLHDQQDTAEHNFVRNAREYKRVCDENDKLHDEVERLHAEQAHWELGNCPSCQNVVSLQEALEQNAKLQDKAAKFDKIHGSWKRLRSFVLHLHDENDRLRELLGRYATAASYLCGRAGGCRDCNLDCASSLGSDPHGWDCARMLLDKEARELGVEA